jgi:hypothetical protein
MEDKINFGKYKGKTIDHVFYGLGDYSYLLWAFEKGLITLSSDMAQTCKNEVHLEQIMHEAIVGDRMGDSID